MPDWRKNLVVIWFANFATLVGVSSVVPFLPLIMRSTGVTDPAQLRILSGTVYAAAFLSAALMGPLWGLIGDRHGRKLMVLRSLFAIAVFMSLQSQIHSWWLFILLRLLHGAFSGFIAPGLTLVSSSTPPHLQGRVASILQTSLVSGGFAGPLIGGLVADRWDFHVSFLVAAGLSGLAFFLVLIFAKDTDTASSADRGTIAPNVASSSSILAKVAAEKTAAGSPSPDKPVSRPSLRGDIAAMFENPGLRRLVLLVFLFQFGVAISDPLTALFVHQLDPTAGNLTTGSVCAAAALANLFMTLFWGRVSEFNSYETTLRITLGCAALFYFQQILVDAPWHLWPLRLAIGCCLAGILPSAYALVGFTTPVSQRGGSFGLTLSASHLGNCLGPLFGGVFSAVFGLRSVFIVTAAILLFSAWLVQRIKPRDRRKSNLDDLTFTGIEEELKKQKESSGGDSAEGPKGTPAANVPESVPTTLTGRLRILQRQK